MKDVSDDAFGNRVSKKSYADEIIETVYKYNKKNQLVSETEQGLTSQYHYDHRGNIKTVTAGNEIIKQFCFDARNILSDVTERIGGVERNAKYEYNGLGNRIGQTISGPVDPEQRIRYTIDVTRQYHNMLAETQENENTLQQTQFYYDFNVVGMSRAVGDDYFIHDDLGSPMSVFNKAGQLDEAYAYDEFGQEFGNVIDARERFQPLSYTGYQKEAVGDTYFAQARRYDASSGRFVSEDKVNGFIDMPSTFNSYEYCWNNPIIYCDYNGMFAVTAIVGAASGAIIGIGTELIASAITGEKPNVKSVVTAGISGAIGDKASKLISKTKVANVVSQGIKKITNKIGDYVYNHLSDYIKEMKGDNAVECAAL